MLVFAIAWFSATAASAARLEGKVVGLSDGDTVTVLDASRTAHKVRLAGIDAPEKSQPFGHRAKRHLADLVLRKQVVVEWSTHDRYGRMVGKVLVQQQDAGLAQVSAGMAWHYKAYQRDQSPEDQTAYAAAEDAARRTRTGLWRAPAPTTPWDFRHARRAD
ncbi:thermonuclease family protein [Sphaerotilus microaerophilus]|uniref:thermonuclease family protein n=1 Tax=Sphaerotilus microaerophilus TaxID=2914710 RepID=UPI002073C1EB|nr:thermonuclease family protein [Sphaerotilus sp. FB-5]